MAASLALGAGALTPAHAAGKTTDLTADQALQRLKDGNRKFMAEAPDQTAAAAQMDNPRLNHERRLEIAQGQTPFAVLVSCSDSRVPPELLFGRGLGELFIVRNAGNTVDTVALGSIEYAVAQLGVPLVLVLGHERCGAVDAALSVVEKNATFPGSIGQMIEPIIPAALQAKNAAPTNADREQVLDMAVRENVKRTVTRLRSASEPILMDPLKGGKLKIVGARYDLDDGSVDFFMEN
jgi:carbonic anhydrase